MNVENFQTKLLIDQRGAEIGNLPVDPIHFGSQHLVNNPREQWFCHECGGVIAPHQKHFRRNYYPAISDKFNYIPLREHLACTTAQEQHAFKRVLFTIWDEQNTKAQTDCGIVTLQEAYTLLDSGKLRKTNERTVDGSWYELGAPSFMEFAQHKQRIVARLTQMRKDTAHFEGAGVGQLRELAIVRQLAARLDTIEITYARLRDQERASWPERRVQA